MVLGSRAQTADRALVMQKMRGMDDMECRDPRHLQATVRATSCPVIRRRGLLRGIPAAQPIILSSNILTIIPQTPKMTV